MGEEAFQKHRRTHTESSHAKSMTGSLQRGEPYWVQRPVWVIVYTLRKRNADMYAFVSRLRVLNTLPLGLTHIYRANLVMLRPKTELYFTLIIGDHDYVLSVKAINNR